MKELVRQSETQHGRNTASAQEKVKNIAQRLSNLKSKTSKSKNRSSSDISEEYGISNIEEEEPMSLESSHNMSTGHLPSTSRARSETPGSEKITLLRKQMEVNRMKMAERESKSKEIEQMVTQLKSKLETSQMSLEKSVELGRSMGDLSVMSMVPQHSQSVSDVSFSTSHAFSLENERIKFLEKRIRQLESTISDKENMTESDKVQQLEGKILDLEENLREKESIIEARTKAVSLLSDNLTKKKKDVVDSLEETKQEMFKMQETFVETETNFKDKVDRRDRLISEQVDEIENLKEKCEILEKTRYDLTLENSELKTKLEDVQDYSTKISELNKLNETLQKQIAHLESQRFEIITEDEVSAGPKENNEELLEKIKSLEELLQSRSSEMEELEENLQEKTVELDVVNANFAVLQEKYTALGPKSLFPADVPVDEGAQAEIAKLKQQLDDSNKNAIKTKLKIKQLQKQVDSFKKGDSNQEVARLTDEVQSLTQRIAEMEEEKGSNQWQEWGDENESELEKKVKVLEATCHNQTAAIQLLEEQKVDMTEDLHNAKQELGNVRDSSDAEVRLRELEERVHQLTDEKSVIEAKLTRYVSENMELHERIDKLSKGSSAESIEMVNLTAQENEEYQKALGAHKDLGGEGTEISQELNESLKSLREESSELMSKIELFTIERREVLDKLDSLTVENQVLLSSIESIRDEKVALEHENESLKASVERTESLLSELQSEKDGLMKKVSELSEHRSKLQEEINKLVKQGIDASASGSGEKSTEIDKEACEKLLKQLDAEIQAFAKNKDKQKTLKISKKLSEHARSVHTMTTNILVDYFKTLDECKQLRDLSVIAGSSNEDELRQLQQKLQESESALITRNDAFATLQAKFHELQQENLDLSEINELKSQLEAATRDLKHKDEATEKFEEMINELTIERDRCEMEVQQQRSLVSDLRKEFDQLCSDVKVNNQRLNEKSSELDQLQREFDMRLKTSTNEVEVLKTLVAEQKQLLIDSYQEHELDINQKIKEVNDYQNQLKQMEDEMTALKQQNASNQQSYVDGLNAEVAKLKKLLDESNKLLEDHKEELLHKQETIDTLNGQIIDLYKTMEENSNKIIEKEDELQYLQEINDTSREEMRKLHQQVSELNKTVGDLRSQVKEKNRENELLQQKTPVASTDPQAEHRVKELEKELEALDAKNKEQLVKLKKFATNLKKKQVQCTELEEKLAAGTAADVIIDANELRAQIIQYEEQLNIVRMENSKLNNSLQKSASDDDQIAKLEYQKDVIEQQSTVISKLTQQLQDSSSKADDLEESLFNLQSQVQKLETENMKLTESSKAMKEISVELVAVKNERDELKAKLGDQEPKENSEDKKKVSLTCTILKISPHITFIF